MALSTNTILDTLTWAKRFNFNRNSVLGNSLEPALTSAQMVMQTILGPPFDWWWNTQELVFTCNPTPGLANATAVSIAAGVMTVTANNAFDVNDLVLGSGFKTITALNGLLIEVATLVGSAPNYTGFTANVNLPNGTDTTGVFTEVTTQDYTIPAPNFSHIEHASILDLSGPVNGVYTPTKWTELTVKNNLALDSKVDRPAFIGPEVEDGLGNVKFRVMPSPGKPYPIAIHVQLAAPDLAATGLGVNNTWAPLPDFMEYIYNWGFLAFMWHFAGDPRAAYAKQQFVGALLGRAEGLDEEERNIFLNNWDMLTPMQDMKAKQAQAMRGQ